MSIHQKIIVVMMFLSHLCVLPVISVLCVWSILFSCLDSNPLVVTSLSDEEQKQWCFEMKKQYNILPGKSFGTLPFHEQDAYLKARCYRFFCKPHPLAGKGVFECEPLESTT